MAKAAAILLLLVLVFALLLPRGAASQAPAGATPPVVFPQGPVTPQVSDSYWSAAYWDNMSLAGSPTVVRNDNQIQFNWGTGSPAPQIEPNTFSARWQRYINVAPGTYRFTVTSDDGIRLWIDGDLLLDEWYDHAATTYYVDQYLTDGPHLVQVDYYENTGLAVASVDWVPAGQAVGRWQAEYYNNMTLSGAPALVRNEATLDFDWMTGSPAPEVIEPDTFSARYTTSIDFPPNNYTFMLTTDDGARLWVNDQLLIDAWYEQAANLYVEDMYLSGPTTLRVEYFENTGLARLQLDWSPDIAEVPTNEVVVVDNLDPGFIRGGAPSGWHSVPEGFDNNLYWTRSHAEVTPNYNWARWYPTLVPGTYEVSVYIPYRYTTTSSARYWIAHAGGLTLRVVDQSNAGSQWVSLGTYQFLGTGGEYVSLADVTFEPEGETRLVAFDAVRWIPR